MKKHEAIAWSENCSLADTNSSGCVIGISHGHYYLNTQNIFPWFFPSQIWRASTHLSSPFKVFKRNFTLWSTSNNLLLRRWIPRGGSVLWRTVPSHWHDSFISQAQREGWPVLFVEGWQNSPFLLTGIWDQPKEDLVQGHRSKVLWMDFGSWVISLSFFLNDIKQLLLQLPNSVLPASQQGTFS